MRRWLGYFKIYKYGGSNSVIIPKKILDSLNLKIGDEMPVELDEAKGELIFKIGCKV